MPWYISIRPQHYCFISPHSVVQAATDVAEVSLEFVSLLPQPSKRCSSKYEALWLVFQWLISLSVKSFPTMDKTIHTCSPMSHYFHSILVYSASALWTFSCFFDDQGTFLPQDLCTSFWYSVFSKYLPCHAPMSLKSFLKCSLLYATLPGYLH